MTERVNGTCPYCDRPATAAGACGLHTELLEGEPDVLARQLERQAELEQLLGTNPLGRRRRGRACGGSADEASSPG